MSVFRWTRLFCWYSLMPRWPCMSRRRWVRWFLVSGNVMLWPWSMQRWLLFFWLHCSTDHRFNDGGIFLRFRLLRYIFSCFDCNVGFLRATFGNNYCQPYSYCCHYDFDVNFFYLIGIAYYRLLFLGWHVSTASNLFGGSDACSIGVCVEWSAV